MPETDKKEKSTKGSSKKSKASNKGKKRKDKDGQSITSKDSSTKSGTSAKSKSKSKSDKKSPGKKSQKKGKEGREKSTLPAPVGEASKAGDEAQPQEVAETNRSKSVTGSISGAKQPVSGKVASGGETVGPQSGSSGQQGDGAGDYLGMYRNIAPTGIGRLAPVHKAFAKFYPWRPKGNIFLTSGYYFDMDKGGAGYGLKPTEVMIHNLPANTTESALRKEFPTASQVKINSDGTARLEFKNSPEAEKAYHDSQLVKLGNRHLAWMNPDEVYLVGIPPGMTADDINRDYPGNKGISFVESAGARRTAVIKFASPSDADQGFQRSPYKKIGNRQNGYEMDDNPIHLNNIPPGVTEDDIRKKFPGAKEVKIDHASGTATVKMADNDAARKAYKDADLAHLGKPKLAWLRPEEMAMEGVPNGTTESNIKKEFPNAKNVTFMDGEGGKRVAIIEFPSEGDQKKAWNGSRHEKIGPQRLGFSKAKPGKADPNAQLKIQGVPNGLTANALKKLFPGATDVTLDGKGGAIIQFSNPDEAGRAYEDSDLAKLKNRNLGFLTPSQLALEGLPKKLKEADIKKDFPTAKSIKLVDGKDGKRVALVDFGSEGDQKHAYANSHHIKVGPQRLGFDGKAGGDPKTQVKIQNVPNGVTEDDLKKRFPGAVGVTIGKGGKAIVYFDTAEDASKGYNDTDMAKLGDNSVAFLGPNQLAVQGFRKKKDKKVKEGLPNAQKVHWIPGPNKTKIAVVDFVDPSARKKDFDASPFEKLGPQTLGASGGVGDDDDDLDGLDDMEIARKLWKLKGADFSNISNLFSASIRITGIPTTMKGIDLIKMFDECKKCEFQGTGAQRAAILEFDKPTAAAKAFGKAKKLKIEGKEVQVKVVPIGGGKKKEKSKASSQASSKRPKK